MLDETYEVRPLPVPLPGLYFGVYRTDRLSGLRNAAALCYTEEMAQRIADLLNVAGAAKRILQTQKVKDA